MKILLVTRGSQGDIYPYLTITSALIKRGHQVTLNLPQIFEKEAKAGNKEAASNNLNIAIQRIDKAMSSGLVHKNKAARLKSRLTKMKNGMN